MGNTKNTPLFSKMASIPLLLYYIFLLYKYLSMNMFTPIIDWLILGIHEAGHAFFIFFGQTLSAAGGTVFEILAPLLSMLVFKRQNDRVGISFCIAWLAVSLFGISYYIADARIQVLNTVSFNPSKSIHDWYFLLGKVGLLEYNLQIASVVKNLAIITLAGAIFYLGKSIYNMFLSKN